MTGKTNGVIPQTQIDALKLRIARLSRELDEAYIERRALIVEQAKTMTYREIAAVWDVSSPAINQQINGKWPKRRK